MSILLSTMVYERQESSISSSGPSFVPQSPDRRSTTLHDLNDPHTFSSTPLRLPLDVEDGVLKEGRIFAIIAVLTGVQFLSSLSNGFLTVGLPRIASDLSLPEHLLLWPSGVY